MNEIYPPSPKGENRNEALGKKQINKGCINLNTFVFTSGSPLEIEFKDFVLNKQIPDTPFNHRKVWRDSHPDETLTSDDLIHHINGNHSDNRPENLKKVTPLEHRRIHSRGKK